MDAGLLRLGLVKCRWTTDGGPDPANEINANSLGKTRSASHPLQLHTTVLLVVCLHIHTNHTHDGPSSITSVPQLSIASCGGIYIITDVALDTFKGSEYGGIVRLWWEQVSNSNWYSQVFNHE